MRRIRGGSGLGDSVYLRPVVEYFIGKGHLVMVMSNYRELFNGTIAKVMPFKKNDVDVVAHYANYRRRQATNQFQDICESARIPLVPMRFDWQIVNTTLVEAVRRKANGRKVVLVHGGRAPFGRVDGLGMEIMPQPHAFEAALSGLNCFTVRIGKGKHFYDLPADLDLVGETNVSDLIDLTKACDAVITQCGFPIPLAECFDKKVLAIFGAAGLNTSHPLVRLVTPAKILCKPSSSYVVDDWPVDRIKERMRESLGTD